MPTLLKYTTAYLLWVGFDLWFGYQTYLVIQADAAALYTENELFWHYLLWIIAPVVPIIFFHFIRGQSEHRSKLLAPMVSAIPVMLIILLLYALDPGIMQQSLLYFIPPFSLVSVFAIFAYSFMVVGLSHLGAREINPNQDDIAHTAFKLLAFLGSIMVLAFVVDFGLTEVSDYSFDAMKVYIVALTIPIYITVATFYVLHGIKGGPKLIG